MTMYEKRPTRWGDLPRTRSDVFLPVLEPWEDSDTKVSAVQEAYRTLPAGGDEAEDRIFAMLFDVFGHRKHQATTLPAIKPTVTEFLAQPDSLTFRLPDYDPDYPGVRLHGHHRLLRGPCPNSRPCTDGPWSCTTSTRGTGPGSSSSRPATSPTTTWSSPSTRGTPRCGGSCAA